jgi:hypothetical protein
VSVSVLAITAKGGGLGRILEIKELQATIAGTCKVDGGNSDRNTIFKLLIDHHIVRATTRKVSEVTSKVLSVIEPNWLCRVNCQKLLHIEDLDTVTSKLRADQDVVLVTSNFLPQCATGGRSI